MENIWVYDDEFVKGLIHIEGDWIQELYVDYFFQNKGIGAMLIAFAIRKFDVRHLYVLEKNTRAIRLSGFWIFTDTRTPDSRRDNRVYCKNGQVKSVLSHEGTNKPDPYILLAND